jgi:hypothetical protein
MTPFEVIVSVLCVFERQVMHNVHRFNCTLVQVLEMGGHASSDSFQ